MQSLSRPLWVSIAGHVFLVLLVFLKAVLVPDQPFEIQSAIRVDVVGLPEKNVELPPQVEELSSPADEAPPIQETPKAEATPTPPLPKPAPLPSPTKTSAKPESKKPDIKSAQKKALDRIKRAQALEKIKSDLQADAAKQQVIKGNQLAKGNSLTGLERLDYDQYYDELEGRIRANWSLPEWLNQPGLKAQVQILIDERGYIVKKIFRKSSGNQTFDEQVTAALEASSPLPPPPQRLRGFLSTSGIILNFPE